MTDNDIRERFTSEFAVITASDDFTRQLRAELNQAPIRRRRHLFHPAALIAAAVVVLLVAAVVVPQVVSDKGPATPPAPAMSTTAQPPPPGITGVTWTKMDPHSRQTESLLLRTDGTARFNTTCRTFETTWRPIARGFHLDEGAAPPCVGRSDESSMLTPLLGRDVVAQVVDHVLVIDLPATNGLSSLYDPDARTVVTGPSEWRLSDVRGPTSLADVQALRMRIEAGVVTIHDNACGGSAYAVVPLTDLTFDLVYWMGAVPSALDCASAPNPPLADLLHALRNPEDISSAALAGCCVISGAVQGNSIVITARSYTLTFSQI
ncbi:hypothetical protein GIS00_06550 [Nakamurella sp. YIM 132087]|uniref:Uncharacterized protein n=1 Tax=Nakamurella alba TaxID=2665158 RepID=A0A7K1FHK3_9ACTN|nr:hypothetical protein [Nakamurella alba]MTD13602.1 hypothetical protein [Nakamurella alba]